MEALWGLVLPLIASIWVYTDAQKHGINAETGARVSKWLAIGPGVWSFLCFMFLIVGLPAYLINRAKLIEASRPFPSVPAPAGQKKCPYCAEVVQLEARLCKHCSSKIA